MPITNEINAWANIITAITAIASIAIAVKTLKQNNMMIEESIKPELTLIIFADNKIDFYLKNVGKSDATVKEIYHNIDFSKCDTSGYYPFKECIGAVIPPGQYIHYSVINYEGFCNNNSNGFEMEIKYESNIGKKYTLSQKYSVKALQNQSYTETHITNENANKVIAKYIEKLFQISRL